jgi:drug/metabolite transporter (DMT)-like permease
MWIVYSLLAAILWGLNYSLNERILQSISTVTLLAFEMTAAAVIFSSLSYFTSFKQDWYTMVKEPDLFILIAIEALVLVLASLFILMSIQEKNATAAGIIELIYPLFTIFFSWVLFQKYHVNASVIMGAILIFFGVILISR